MDLDTLHIASTLWNNPEQTEKAVQKLEAIKNTTGQLSGLSDADRKKVQEAVAAAYQDVRAAAPPQYAWQTTPDKFIDWAAKVLGWILTALATSLGAQFWFNIMSEALKLRSTKKPDSAK
jgi:hypothetical protein